MLAFLLALLTSPALADLDLLTPEYAWAPSIDSGGTVMEQPPATAEVPLAVTVRGDGGNEDYPKFATPLFEARDWTRYSRLEGRVRVTTDDPNLREKRLTIVFYDQKTVRTDLADRPLTQQCKGRSIPVNEWVDIREWLSDIHRTEIVQMCLYLYEDSEPPQTCTWEFASLKLIDGAGATAFDTEFYPPESLRATPGPAAFRVGGSDGFGLALTQEGAVSELIFDGLSIGGGSSAPSGLLVRDAATREAPVPAGGVLVETGGVVRQEATIEALQLGLSATYRAIGPIIEVAGAVRNLRDPGVNNGDRAVTVCFAVPVGDGPWQWWDGPAAPRVAGDDGAELSWVETGMEYGQNGVHSKYPLGALSLPGQAGVTMALRMDEPVVHRIAYNPALKLLYVALDFGLTSGTTIRGRSLDEAPFRFLLYRHDPAWGMRSAIQRYYDLFPYFFPHRVARQGGWYVWGNMPDTEGALEAGFGFHWGPGGPDAVRWDNEHGIPALQYIEAELYQQAMGDWDHQPTLTESMERLRKLAEGDPAETAAFQKLGYGTSYTPGYWVKRHSQEEATRAIAQAAVRSCSYGRDGKPNTLIAQLPWITESQWGTIFACNLDPDIPGGKGEFAHHVYLDSGLLEMQEHGVHFDGIALDSLGGFGNHYRANFRREHFQYADIPLTFAASNHQPVQAAFCGTVEFLRDLSADMHGRGLILMANCAWGFAPGWLTWAAPYLDVFGAEASSFGDPEFMRTIAYRRCLTDLPYTPRPDDEVAWHALLNIFPGHGNKVEVMARQAKLLRDLATAGWEPITHARTTATAVRLERYGYGPGLYLVAHNPGEAALAAAVEVDLQALGLAGLSATDAQTGSAIASEGSTLDLELPARGTVVVKLGG